jgi:hypothetical protein
MMFRITKRIELRADPRSAAERRFDALMLAGHIGRHRPGWAGERGRQLLNETADLRLPWEIDQ